MPSLNTSPTRKSPTNSSLRRALYVSAPGVFAAFAVYAAVSAAGCAPVDFTFEESNTLSSSSSGSTSSGQGGGTGSSTSSGAVGGMGGGSISSSTSTSASSSSSSSGVPEICDSGFTCAPPVPGGWTGYDIILVDPAGGPKPACPLGDMATKMFADPVTTPHTCSACGGCSRSGAACTSPEITCWVGDTDCANGTAATYPAVANNTCVNETNVPVGEGVLAACKITGAPSISDQGTCNVNSTANPMKPGTWQSDVHTCDANLGAACGVNKICVTTPFAGQQICVHKAGTDACPAGFPNSVQSYSGANDSRGCSACGCAAITGCSGGNYTAYDYTNCDGASPVIAVIDSNACLNATDIFDGSASSLMPGQAAPVDPQQCTGGSPTGSLTPTGAVKYCCL